MSQEVGFLTSRPEVNKMEPELVFSVSEIRKAGGLKFSRAASAQEFMESDAEPEAWGRTFGVGCRSGSYKMELEFSVGGDRVLLEGKVEGQWMLTCSRCLEPHQVSFETVLEETYPLSDESVDLRPEVREALILSVPSKSLCSPTCLGLCQQCGRDLNRGPCGCAQAGQRESAP